MTTSRFTCIVKARSFSQSIVFKGHNCGRPWCHKKIFSQTDKFLLPTCSWHLKDIHDLLLCFLSFSNGYPFETYFQLYHDLLKIIGTVWYCFRQQRWQQTPENIWHYVWLNVPGNETYIGSSFGGIFHYHWWTASIKPRLLFSHSGLVSWGLLFLQFNKHISYTLYKYFFYHLNYVIIIHVITIQCRSVVQAGLDSLSLPAFGSACDVPRGQNACELYVFLRFF